MIDYNQYEEAMIVMSFLPTQADSVGTWEDKLVLYYRALTQAKVEQIDFIEATQRISFLDKWFPLPVRLIEACDECARDRRHTERLRALPAPSSDIPLVCPFCHGARHVRLGGPSHLKTKPGVNEGDRIRPCPGCTLLGQHSPHQEIITIGKHGGVPDPTFDREPDMKHNTWRAPRREDGSVDLDALYRESRVLRQLDPNVDKREHDVAGFKTFRSAIERTMR